MPHQLQVPPELLEPENASLLTGILRGVERESLRVTPTGNLAVSPHPERLGAALTHPQITTDFSEALLEFITPPCHSIDDLLNNLSLLQRFTAQQLEHGERLWTQSMPCALGEDDSIPVAQYGKSNNGRMKTVYRVGLGHRYGRAMQTVAGVHYNFSLPNAFWAFLRHRDNSILNLQAYKDRAYFGLIRNFRRYYWLLIYLFGSSPAICRSFVRDRPHDLEFMDELSHTLHAPYGTSLRMGDLGYQSSAQEDLYVCYNDKNSYINSLCRAITQEHKAYADIGTTDEAGNYRQLNTGLLQIENEFYSSIRPKRAAKPGETALSALDNRGVEYIEVRCLDVSTDSVLGITDEQIRFLDVFLIFCALMPSPDTHKAEAEAIMHNQKRVVRRGREPGLKLRRTVNEEVELKTWGLELLEQFESVATALDTANGCTLFSESLHNQAKKLEDPSLTPSARLLEELKSNKLNYARYALQLSERHHQQLLNNPPTSAEEKRLVQMRQQSIEEQRALEAPDQQPFAEFLERYYGQYTMCKNRC